LGHWVATSRWKPLAAALPLALLLHASWNAAQEVPLFVLVQLMKRFHLRAVDALDLWSLLLGLPLLAAIVVVVRLARSRRAAT
jgi:hypothetical protein